VTACHYCKTAPGVTRDHIVPKSLGGPSEAWNIVKACAMCNHAKGAKWPTCRCTKCSKAVWKFNILAMEWDREEA
jgi:5-methylcytosine-specific restriction endonuclease McrA